MRSGVVSAVFMSLIVLEYIFRNRKFSGNKVTLLLILYIYYNILAILIAAIKGYPLLICITDFSYSILPMIFYFIALEVNDLQEYKFVKSFMYACLFLILVGIYMYFTLPNIYSEYLLRTHYNYAKYQQYYELHPRMHSFVGSVAVGSLGCMAFTIALDSVISKKRNLKLYTLICAILLIGVFLAMQRSAWVFAIITIVLISVSTVQNKRNFLRIVLTFAVFVIIAFFIANEFNDLSNQFLARLSSMTTAIDERNSEWGYLWVRGIGNFFIGDGFGTRGHRAMQISDLTIRDGYYIKLFFEIGIIGTFMFLGMMISTIIIGLRSYKKSLPYICIVLGILFQAIGSNILDFQLLGPMFWFSVGRINRKDKKSISG